MFVVPRQKSYKPPSTCAMEQWVVIPIKNSGVKTLRNLSLLVVNKSGFACTCWEYVYVPLSAELLGTVWDEPGWNVRATLSCCMQQHRAGTARGSGSRPAGMRQARERCASLCLGHYCHTRQLDVIQHPLLTGSAPAGRRKGQCLELSCPLLHYFLRSSCGGVG